MKNNQNEWEIEIDKLGRLLSNTDPDKFVFVESKVKNIFHKALAQQKQKDREMIKEWVDQQNIIHAEFCEYRDQKYRECARCKFDKLLDFLSDKEGDK